MRAWQLAAVASLLCVIAVGDDQVRSLTDVTAPKLSNQTQCGLAENFSYHDKDFWPPNLRAIITLTIAGVGLIIAAGGGIGGGSIVVPLYMILLGFRPKHAIALSNLTIFGGSISNGIFNLRKPRVEGVGHLIDWDIIIMMEPSTIAGAVIGSFMSKYLPDFVLTASLAVVLGLLAYRTMDKGITMYQKESLAMGNSHKVRERNGLMMLKRDSSEEDEDSYEDEPEEARFPSDSFDADEDEPVHLPWLKIGLLVLCFAGCVVLTILKGSGSYSLAGVACGSPMFWFLSLSNVPWVIAFGVLFRWMLLHEAHEVAQGSKQAHGHIQWDARTTITYPVLCTVAGLFAGLFGVGGGIVKGPLMLEMGVNPLVAAATAATMIFFTTSAACVSFAIFGELDPKYSTIAFLLGLICTAVGQGGINRWMESAKRHSPPVLSIGTVLAVSTLLVTLEAVQKLRNETPDQLWRPTPLCSTC